MAASLLAHAAAFRLGARADSTFRHAQRLVRTLAGGPACDAVARHAFGVSGAALADAIGALDRTGWPRLRVIAVGPEPGCAAGAYVAATDTIYLDHRAAEDLGLMLHEIGHALDQRLPGLEADGDEGAIFAAMLLGRTPAPAELDRMRGCDDHGVLVLDGQHLAAEFGGTYGRITIDGNMSDWQPSDRIDLGSNAVSGYQMFGTVQNGVFLLGIDATSGTDPVIGANTTIWLNTDLNRTTGYGYPWGFTTVGAEYNITFNSAGIPYLYTGAAGQTLANPTPLDFSLSPNGESLEIALPASLVTPTGGTAPTAIDTETVIDGSEYLPGDFSTAVPEYRIKSAPAPQTFGSITLDGSFADWTAAQRLDNVPGDAVAGYAIYGTAAAGDYLFGLQSTASTDAQIGPGSTIWLDTDLNRATGTELWGGTNIGAEYNVTFDSTDTPYLYTGTAGQTLASSTPLSYALSPDGKSLEFAVPESLLAPAGGTLPTTIDFTAEIATAGSPNTITYLPGDYTSAAQYQITDPASLPPKLEQHKVAIVYSDTTAAKYFSTAAYSDLFMAAQNQARMAGVSYDIIDESQLTSIKNLVGYDALIFPDMSNVNTAQLPAILQTLTQAVYDYGISIITSGDFLTNDQTGAALPGNPYANMAALLNLTRAGGGNDAATVTVNAYDTGNPILQGYTSGQVIQTYSNEGYTDYEGVTAPTDVLVTQAVSGVSNPLPAVVETKTGGNNVEFSSQDLLGDSNLLSNVIQSIVLGTQPGVALHTSRSAGIVAARMDMDQSQFVSDVSPTNDAGVAQPGIYDKLVPILQQWKAQYDFVGSYYINVGNQPGTSDPSTTNWAVSLPYYQAIEALGGEIGNHSYTHLIQPPTTTVTETTVGDTPIGSTTITLSGIPSFAGQTLGMVVSGPGIGDGVVLPGVAGESGAIANSQITAVNGNTVTILFQPGGYGTADTGTTADIPSGTTLTFSIPQENTNFLQTTGTTLSAAGAPFTYDYEFNQSKQVEQANLGNTIDGAAVPGAPEQLATSMDIQQYYPSTSTYTGYVTGGWTGIGAGYPSAFGYLTPTDTNSVYIAPNVTFDFTEIQFEGKSIAQAQADWSAQLSQLAANAAGTPVIVWPIHDYGASAWDTSDSGATSPYTTQLYTNFIAQASAQNYEFVTLEELAARIAAQQKATVNSSSSGNAITATVTPDPSAPDLGAMALSVVNGGANVIENVGNWYAYNAQEVFVPRNGGTFTINLGASQDDVTHISSLPQRADLISVSGDGANLNFSMTGDGTVGITLKAPVAATRYVSIQGAPAASLSANQLTLSFADTLLAPTYTPITHAVAVEEGATELATSGSEIVFGTAANETFTPVGSGANTFYGAGGTNSFLFSGPQSSYQITQGTNGAPTVVRDLRAGSPDGTDTLFGITNLMFAAPPVAPAVTAVAASGAGITNGAGLVGAGAAIALTVSFSEAVNVAGGTPTLTLNDGGTATYTGGSGTSALTFSTTVAAGQASPDLAVTAAALNGATIRDAGGIDAAFAGAVVNPPGTLQVDGVAPTVVAVATSGTGITNGTGLVGINAVVTLTATFSKAVTVAGGTPSLTLNDGGTATYTGGSGTSALTFTTTIAAGQSAADLAVTAAALNGATIRDAAGNNAVLTGAVVNPPGTLQVAGVPPTLSSITTSGAGITSGTGDLKAGSVVTLSALMSEAVTVSGGTPILALNDGGTASYTGGAGTGTLAFSYTVASGQNTADLTVTSVALNGATIGDAAGNVFTPATGTINPAGTLQIDTAAPTITIGSVAGNNTVNATKAANGFAVTGTTGGTGGVENGQIVSVNLLNAASQVVATVTGQVSGNSWSANVTSAQATALSDGSYKAVATVADKAGNPATSAALAFAVAEGPHVPVLTLASKSLQVNAGSSAALGITASSGNSADLVSVTIAGVPTYESITAPAGDTVTSVVSGTTKTWTIKAPSAGVAISGLTVASNYTGTGKPVATFSVKATSTEASGSKSSAAQTMAVTDPPSAMLPSSGASAVLAAAASVQASAPQLLAGMALPAGSSALPAGLSTAITGALALPQPDPNLLNALLVPA